jgi:hypothetical protein
VSGEPPLVVDRAGRELVTATLEQLVEALDLVEETTDDGGPALALRGAFGPVDGQPIGAFRVYRGSGVRLVYSALTHDLLGLDTHQVYGFTAEGSAVPHFFLDSAISPSTDGTFHLGLDLAPRVDLGVHLGYSQAVFDGLADLRAEALARPGVLPVPSLGPLQWSLRSPWMVAAITDRAALRSLGDVVAAYRDRWVALVRSGLPEGAGHLPPPGALAERDAASRATLFSPRANPVWGLLGRLVGEEQAEAMRALLVA